MEAIDTADAMRQMEQKGTREHRRCATPREPRDRKGLDTRDTGDIEDTRHTTYTNRNKGPEVHM